MKKMYELSVNTNLHFKEKVKFSFVKMAAVVVFSCLTHFSMAQTVRINEILTANQGSITNLYDEDGSSPDYIELYNTQNSSVDLSNWILVDDNNIWKIPSGTTISANDYLTIWASGKDRTSPQLHTNFELNKGGEYLGLYDNLGNLVSDFGAEYPQQYDNISYGYTPSGGLSYFNTMSQNTANTNAVSSKIATPQATIGRGFYTSTVVETITCTTPGAEIRYTTDGTNPTNTSTLYTGAITINPDPTGIFTIRAKAFSSGAAASEEVSWSYVFPDALYSDLAADGLRSLPIVSVQVDNQDYPAQTKIRTNVEMIEVEPDSIKTGFSVTAGIKEFGQSSLNHDKSSMRLFFDSEYGPSNLEYPVFDGYGQGHIEPTTVFDKLELRGMSWDGYAWKDSYYVTDRWWKDSRLDMGELDCHGRYVNVFVNGDYRGVYQLRERLDHQFYASYTDEPAEDFEAIKYDDGQTILINGDASVYNSLNQDYQAVKNKINAKALIHHAIMMSVTYRSPEIEYRGAGTTNPQSEYGYILSHNDNDYIFKDYSPGFFTGDLPFFDTYRTDPEFLQEVYEETAKHLCGDGAMTVSKMVERLNYWRDEINSAMHSESTRWAGGSYSSSIPDTQNGIYDHWSAKMVDIEARMLSLSPNLILEWTAQDLYRGCDLRPQVITEDQVDALNSTVSYVINATDPDGDAMNFTVISGLPPGLNINSSTGEITGTPTQVGVFEVKIQVGDTNDKWGYHYFTWEILNQAPITDGIVINEIMYHPDSLCLDLNAKPDLHSYIELKNISNQAIDLSGSAFTDGLDFEFPAGAIVQPGDFYVIAEGECAFQMTYGFAAHAIYKGGLNNDGERIELSDAYGNILDSLTFNDVNPWDEDPDGKGPSLELLHPTLDNTDPINWFRSDFSCGTPGAENSRVCTGTAESIVINEINYNSDNDVTDPGDWVELYNPTANPIDLSDWTFYDNNNEFIFPAGTIIQPDDYLVLVENDAMFIGIFPHLTSNEYIGNFAFGLSNKGERVSLFDENKCLSDYVVFDDRIPWDTIPDGNGPTLSLITPFSDNTLPESWEASSNINSAYGTPGRINAPCLEQQIVFPNTVYTNTDNVLTVDISSDDVTYTWSIAGATSSDNNAEATTVNYANPGTYNIQLITNYFECTKVVFKQVTVLEPACADADNDDVCDADDVCPNFNDALIGTSCDDGDPNTTNDTWGTDCSCTGTPSGGCTITTLSSGGTVESSNGSQNCTTFNLGGEYEDISFALSGINSKINGKPASRYIDLVTVQYISNGSTQTHDTYTSNSTVEIAGPVTEVIVCIEDNDGQTGASVRANVGTISACIGGGTPPACTPGTTCDDGNDCTAGDTYDADCNCVGTYTDMDADGVCVGDDPNDNDPCVPNACGDCTTYNSESFEGNWGIWNNGGNDVSSDALNANTGTSCVRLRDNSGQASSIYTDVLDLSTYSSLDISFSFIASSMETGEDFYLEMSTNGGNSYSVVQSWVSGTDFTNGTRYNETVTVSGMSNATVFRIRCDASANNDRVYIDDVVIEDCSGEERLENTIETVNIFPNPSHNHINVDLSQIIQTLNSDNIEVNIFSVNGKRVYQNDMQVSDILHLNIDALSSSQMYLLHLRTEDGRMFRGKFVKF